MIRIQKLYFYSPKEIVILASLTLLTIIFAFTWGVHLGKRVTTWELDDGSAGVPTVATIEDRVPTDEEFSKHSNGIEDSLEGLLSRELKDETEKNDLHLSRPLPVNLPSRTVSSIKSDPDEKFTVRIGSFPIKEQAQRVMQDLKSAKVHSFVREVAIQGKGTWFRVFSGEYDTQHAAKKAGQQLKSKKIIPFFVVSKYPT